MNLVPTFAWFAGLRQRRRLNAARLDFADMGTAFGLDASMDTEPLGLASLAKPAPNKNGRPETGAPQQRPSHAAMRPGR